MTLFPFFENIENKTFLVVGGGRVAVGKIRRLKNFTDNIIVIADKTEISEVKVINRNFKDEDIFLGDYVIGATDSKQLNDRISFLCKKNNIPVNIVDCPDKCTFIFPSLIKRGDLTIGISSAGKSPYFCKRMREDIENILPDNTEEILENMGKIRQYMKSTVLSQEERSRALKKILNLYLDGQDVTQETVLSLICENK